ncbi:rhodanese-like domain-containing protein [Fulvivirga lutimaris]|uniref:rhodanese-like domain-containing protein n=1 Tax=Fulvivirga lutimaris TaxID=1819566 RepID=UPI00162A2E77|nr:rhodanese-like domain-containing protein [Fulvivirga lutimaris]
MKVNKLSSISLNKKLAALAFILAALAMVASFVAPQGLKNENDRPPFISVVTLAKAIKNREDFRLIDLRDAAAYEEFHLPSAVNISYDSALKMDFKQKVIFYSGDDYLAKRLWEKRHETLAPNAMVLYGGVHDWYEKLLYPELPIKIPEQQRSMVNQVIELSTYYGGHIEFVESQEVLDYYEYDLNKKYWPRANRTNGLVRKGC